MFDAIVVGLGAAGSAAAFQLARRGARVLGIDQFAPPHAMGSSHGDTRITRKAIGEGDAYVPLALRSGELWREIEAQTGEELLVVTGGLWISSPARQAETHVPDFFANTIAAAKRFDSAHELLDAAAIRRRFPQFAVRDNESGYYEPDAGYLRPEACVRAQLTLARRLGAQLHVDERVEGVSQAGDLVTVRTVRGEYHARHAIVAAGAWVARFLPVAYARHFAVTRQVLYWFEVGAPLERFVAPAFPVFIWELQERRHVIYGFPAVDGPAGGLKIATEQYAAASDATSMVRDVSEAEKHAMHDRLVAPYLPGVGPACLKAAACMYTATPDFHFVIDRMPGMPGVIVASPCSGHGFKHSAAVGEALAELTLDGSSRIDLTPFGWSRLAPR